MYRWGYLFYNLDVLISKLILHRKVTILYIVYSGRSIRDN